jgi:hypothetical protein
MCPDAHARARFAVPDNIVRQVYQGRPMMLALLCGGLRTRYEPMPDDVTPNILEGLGTHRRVSDSGGDLVSTDRGRA